MAGAHRSLDAWIDSARFITHGAHRVAYWTSGEGRPLLLIHGYPTSAWDWHKIWQPLAERHRLIACDMPGFGLSDKPRSGYSIHAQTEVHLQLLRALGVDEFNVVAHDYGVSVGQELLARRNTSGPDFGLGRILFLNGGLFPEQHRKLPVQKLGVSPLGFLVGLLMNRQRFEASFRKVFGPETQPDDSELDDFWRLITHQDGHRIAHLLMHYIADRVEHRERWVTALQQASVPVKLVDGGADPVSGKHMYDYFRAMVPQAEAVCFDAIGHYPQIEAPARVLREILDFCE
jgi:pimeloyl-ACP methyl ester carboxylesterase